MCTQLPTLPNGTPVPISPTQHGEFNDPDCSSLGLTTILPLKCENGEFYVVDPFNPSFQQLANGLEFCVDPEHPLVVKNSDFDIESLRRFWQHMRDTHDPTTSGCPEEAQECVNFDDFAQLYQSGRFGVEDSHFLGIQLDVPSNLQYDLYVDEFTREFTFANGLDGRVIEFSNGDIYATLNIDEEDGFTLFIRPCVNDDCEYVMYLGKSEEGEMEDVDDEEELVEDEDQKREHMRVNDEAIQERLAKLPQGRRKLQVSNVVSVTFIYDPAIQSESDARSKAASTVLDFNRGLAQHSNSQFRMLLLAVVATSRDNFNRQPQSVCGRGQDFIRTACRNTQNSLPSTQRGDLTHCFVARNSFTGNTVGCASGNNVGVSVLGYGNTVTIAIHEIGHQMGSPHKNDCWCSSHFIICWHTQCSVMNPSLNNNFGYSMVHRFHADSITQMNRFKTISNNQNSEANVVQNNAEGVGTWGGYCTCPDGQVYGVGDLDNGCNSLACFGGTSSSCNRHDSSAWSRKSVTCGGSGGGQRNVVEENVPGVGTWGGSCTCPDGSVYWVGDNDDGCGSLACNGGTPGQCHRNDGRWRSRRVTCN